MLHSCSEKSKKKSNKNKYNYNTIQKIKYFGINLLNLLMTQKLQFNDMTQR